MDSFSLTGVRILIVEDELLLRKQIAAQLEQLGAEVASVGTLEAARTAAANGGFDFVLLDVNLPDGLGTDLLKTRLFPASTAVIVMTANGGVAGAVEAMRLGAVDYLVKPFDAGELPLVISRARRARQSVRLDEHRRDTAQSGAAFFFGRALAGLEKQLEKILTADARVQGALAPVLIQGETGTGKTTIARLLHHRGPRAAQPLVEVNCSALPEPLAESELFGHERGAFTDARAARLGLFEAANGGTLFLDELPSLSAGLQTKVLKAVEEQRIRRLGGHKEIPVDVRVIAATNRDLKPLVAAGAFREDLFHRLDLFRVVIPPLRERGEDIAILVETLLAEICRRHGVTVKPVSATGQRRLLGYAWPGNVRELAHELERAVVFEEKPQLDFDHLAPVNESGGAAPDDADWFNERFEFPTEGFALEEAINRVIRHALKQTDNNVSAAARLLGVSRDYIRYRLEGTKPPERAGE